MTETPTLKRIAVVGAGAMGSYFAACLASAGHEVCVIDVDRTRLELIGREGIVVEDDRGERRVKLAAGLANEFSNPVDLLIIFTKGMHTTDAAKSAKHLASPDTAVLTLQNGLGNDDVLAQHFGAQSVVIGMTDVPADLTGPNCVSSHGRAHVVIGEYGREAAALVDKVAELIESAGFSVETDAEVRKQIWEKVAFNAAMNASSAVTRLTVGQLDTEAGRRLIESLWREVADVAEALSLTVDRQRIAEKVRNALDHHGGHKPSMLQDVLAGRRTEIETINGAVVRHGERCGVATPVNRILADLVRMVEADRTPTDAKMAPS